MDQHNKCHLLHTHNTKQAQRPPGYLLLTNNYTVTSNISTTYESCNAPAVITVCKRKRLHDFQADLQPFIWTFYWGFPFMSILSVEGFCYFTKFKARSVNPIRLTLVLKKEQSNLDGENSLNHLGCYLCECESSEGLLITALRQLTAVICSSSLHAHLC